MGLIFFANTDRVRDSTIFAISTFGLGFVLFVSLVFINGIIDLGNVWGGRPLFEVFAEMTGEDWFLNGSVALMG